MHLLLSLSVLYITISFHGIKLSFLPLGAELTVDWTGEGRPAWEQRLGGGGPGAVVNVLRKHSIPQRLAEALCQEAGVPLDRCGVGRPPLCAQGMPVGAAEWWGCGGSAGSGRTGGVGGGGGRACLLDPR